VRSFPVWGMLAHWVHTNAL